MKKESNYANTVMYKIVCKDENVKDLYIGHSSNIYVRKSVHQYYSNKKNNKLYTFISLNGGFDNFDLVILEKFPCSTKREALSRERELIELHQATLNDLMPGRTYKELREKNKEKYNEYMRIYMKKYYQKKKNENNLKNSNDNNINDMVYFD